MRGIYLAQTVDVLEMLTGWERVNRYKLQPWDPARGGDRTADGILAPPTLKMKEDSGCLCRQCCGASRAFRMCAQCCAPAPRCARNCDPSDPNNQPYARTTTLNQP
jgi:hypothetical protein